MDNNYGYYNNQDNNQNDAPLSAGNDFKKWMIIGILQFLCCNWITGLITVLLAWSGNSEYNKGNLAGADTKYKHCKTATIIGIIWTILAVILVVLKSFAELL